MPKSNNLPEFRTLDNMTLIKKIVIAKQELTSLMFDKGSEKVKDTSALTKKRRAIAQMATVLRQKELVAALEASMMPTKKVEPKVEKKVEAKPEVKKDTKTKTKKETK